MTPLRLVASSVSRNVIDAASCEAWAIEGIAAMPRWMRGAANSLANVPSMFVATAPGATALIRTPVSA